MGGEVERGHFGGEKTGSLVVKYWSCIIMFYVIKVSGDFGWILVL